MTTSTSHTLAPIPTEAADAPGSSTALLGDGGGDLDFDEELSSLTSRLATGTGICRYYSADGRVAVYAVGGETAGGLCLRNQNLQVSHAFGFRVYTIVNIEMVIRKQAAERPVVYCSRCQGPGDDPTRFRDVPTVADVEALSIGGIETIEEPEIYSTVPLVRPKNITDLFNQILSVLSARRFYQY